MLTNNPYQPTSTVDLDHGGDEPARGHDRPPLRYRLIASSSSAIGTMFAVIGAIGTLGGLTVALIAVVGGGLDAGMYLRGLLAALLVMCFGLGLIYAGILWYNLRARAAIGWSVISTSLLVLAQLM